MIRCAASAQADLNHQGIECGALQLYRALPLPHRAGEEYVRWHTEQHLPDVVGMPGVVSAKLHRMDFQRVYDLDAPQWTLMTWYELEGERPEPIIDALKAASGIAVMPGTTSLDKSGMIQAAGHLIAEIS